MALQPLSQRDSRWKDIKLGTSAETLGGYGCTITCLAMLAGTTPDVVNQRLLAVDGYLNGNLLIWGKIDAALPGVRFIKRGWVYNNDDVKANLPCIVEVDGAPIGGYRHWVVFIGQGQLIDPWDGQIKSTSTYTPLSYAIVQGTYAAPTDPATQVLIDELRIARDRNWNLYTEQQAETEKYKSLYLGAVKSLEIQAGEIGTLRSQVLTLTEKLNSLPTQPKDYTISELVQMILTKLTGKGGSV